MTLRAHALSTLAAATFAASLAACSALPGTRSASEVEAAGFSKSYAGKTRCDPKSADRPFILDWDATDVSSFQTRAASDVVFVRYEGCDLKVIDACSIDELKGTFGSYRPVEWTSGSLETLEINDAADLYAKLPLGAASLGARVEGGEKFHMEYFVSGTRTATRSAIKRADLAKVPACKNATHFVYAFNLGAFGLGAQSSLKGGVGGSAFGFGAGADRSSSSKAEKQGGDLTSCKGKSAKELDTCKVPIRLTLREIDGDDATAAATPEPADAPVTKGALAGMKLTNDRERKASQFYESAFKKANAGDGKACLADLDQHDKLDPRPEYLSTAPKFAITRVRCLMLSGQCPAGKVLARKMVEEFANVDGAAIDQMVEGYVASYCQGGQGAGMSPRDELLHAKDELARAAQKRVDAATCKKSFDTLHRLLPKVKPEDEHDQVVMASEYGGLWAASCFARAGDCNAAWNALVTEPPKLDGKTMAMDVMKQNFPIYTNNLCGKR